MKTHNNIYPKIYDFQALYEAHLKARRSKRHIREVQKFEQDLEGNLIQLQNELIWQIYRVGEYRMFKVYEPKERDIAALPYRDRVVQHSIMAAIEPIFDRCFIYDSYACRKGKGTHKGADRAQEMLRKVKREHGRVYAFKADVEKYFHSIDHCILKRLVRRKIRCAPTLALLDHLIDSMIVGVRPGAGIHVGSLVSQLFAMFISMLWTTS